MPGPRTEEIRCPAGHDGRGWLVAALVFLLTAVVLVFPALRPGKVLAPVDLMYETPVFLSMRPANYDGPANEHIFDQAYQFVPWRYYAWQRMRDGEIPLWNPLSATGTPFVATMQAAVFYPVNLLTLALPFNLTFAASAIVRLWMAGFGTFALMRRYGASAPAGMLSGLSFMLSGFIIGWLGHPHANVAVWLPILILGVEGLCSVRSRPEAIRWWTLLALATGVQFLGGHIETSRDVLLAAGLYAVVRLLQSGRLRWRDRVRRLALAGSAVVLGEGIAAVQLMPFIEWLPLSAEYQRRSGFDFSLWDFDGTTLLALPLAVLPNLYSNPTWDGPYWSFNPWGSYNESVLYAGTIPLALAIAALGRWKSNSFVRIWAITGGVSLGLALQLPVLDWFNQLPGMSLAHPGRLRLITIFAVAVLAGFGLDAVRNTGTLSRVSSWFTRSLAGMAGLTATILVVVNLFLPLYSNWESRLVARAVEHWAGSPDPPRSIVVCRDRIADCGNEIAGAFAASNWQMYLALPVAVAALLVVRVWRQSGRAGWASLALVALTAGELLVVGWGFNPAVEGAILEEKPPVVVAASAVAGDRRVVALQQDMLPDSHILYGLPEVRGLDFKTGWYEIYVDASDSRVPWIANGVLLDGVDPMILALDVGAVMTSNPHLVERLTTDGTMRVVATPGDGLTVLEPVNATPHASMRFDVRIADSDESAAMMLNEDPDALAARAVLPDTPDAREVLSQISGSDMSASVEQIAREPERGAWRVATSATGLLVVSDAYYPGWTATLDGRKAHIHRTNINFRGIVVPPGEHIVEMKYEPRSVRVGGIVTAISIAVLVVVVGVSYVPSQWLPGDRAVD